MVQHFSDAAERNKQPIAHQLLPYISTELQLLEIGSGSGQHALYFNQVFGPLNWQCTELEENLNGLQQNIAESGLKPAQPLDVSQPIDAQLQQNDLVYSANTLHIMPQAAVEALIKAMPLLLKPGGHFIVYGPFSYKGRFSAESNRAFDQWLKQRDPQQGVDRKSVV